MTQAGARGLSLLLSACGVVAALLAWRGLLPLMPETPGAASVGVRLGQAAAALLPSCFVLAGMTVAQMALRFVAGAFDPLAGGETRLLMVNQRVITNSIEQFVVFAPALLALAALAPGSQMPAIMALAVLFALARLVFWGGYLLAPIGRAPGMAATLACNAAALLAAAGSWHS